MKTRTKCILKNLALIYIPPLLVVAAIITLINFILVPMTEAASGVLVQSSNTHREFCCFSPMPIFLFVGVCIIGIFTYYWAIKPCLIKEEEKK